jgi:YihY family inner membrane protein
MNVKALVGRVDRFQRHRAWIGFPIAVFKKFGEDQAANLAALIAYYGFFSVFPLLMVFVTVLGFVLRGNQHLQDTITSSAFANFPVVGTQLSQNVHSLRGSGVALALGIVLTLWSGLGVLKVTQTAMNVVWNVPYERRPNFVWSTVRAGLMLIVLGVITIASAAAGSVGAGHGGALWWTVGILISLVLNLALFLLAFRVLTAEDVSWSDVWVGAAVGAVVWTVLQAFGGYYVGHQLGSASDTYGTFAVVIGLLAWIFIGAQATLLAAEINVVKARRLWPRAVQPPLTEADARALKIYGLQEKRRPEMDVLVDVSREAIAGPAEARGDG